jgi:ferric-dicitrate binding protein FerR (iron transport regulator)
MALTAEQREEFEKLLFALRDGALDAAGYASLEQLVLEHAEARERFVDCMYLQASLHWKYAGTLADVTAEPAIVELPRTASRTQQVGLRRIAVACVAAALLLAVVGVTAFLASRARPGHDQPALARVTKVSDARWNGPGWEEGTGLVAGGRLDLAEGLAEVTFDSGARVVIEGPASFEVLSASRGRLATGTLTARMPPHLKGFVVETPGLTVVDLGTEFGVRASRGGLSEVHVFEGAVEAAATQGEPQTVLLEERQAIQCDPQTGAVEDVIFDEERFVRDLYRASSPAAVAPSFAETFD